MSTDEEIKNARAQGIRYARDRLIAAYETGFVNRPECEVRDICRMLTCAIADMEAEPTGYDFDSKYGDQWLNRGVGHE